MKRQRYNINNNLYSLKIWKFVSIQNKIGETLEVIYVYDFLESPPSEVTLLSLLSGLGTSIYKVLQTILVRLLGQPNHFFQNASCEALRIFRNPAGPPRDRREKAELVGF